MGIHNPRALFLLKGETLNRILDDIHDLKSGTYIKSGPGVLIRAAGAAGIAISAPKGPQPPSGGGASNTSPFQVNVINNSDGTYKAWINEDSSLLLSLIPDDRQAITGLGISAAFNLDGDDLIWLELSFDAMTGGITSATIKSYGLGGTWDVDSKPSESGKHSYVEYTPTTDGSGNTNIVQTLARIRIAQTIAGPDGQPQLNQLLTENLILSTITTDLGYVMAYADPTGFGLYLDKNDQSPPP